MNGYICFWRGKQHEVHADTTLKARDLAAAHWKVKPKKHYEITTVLAEIDGATITHIADF